MILFLVKFLAEEDHVQDLLDGKIYANRLSYFRKIEEADDSGRGDQHEGAMAWHQPDRVSLKIDDVDIAPYLDRPVEIHLSRLDSLNLFCTSGGWIDEDVLNRLPEFDSNDLQSLLAIPERCLSLGQYVVVIMDVHEFIRRVKKAVRAEGYVIGHRPVEYYNPDTYHGSTSLTDAVFRKQDRHSYQSEFRFVIHTPTDGDDATILEIGDIRDIALEFRTRN